eukprot:Nk52_evm79s151 gene=Nk52_evmTU79s151
MQESIGRMLYRLLFPSAEEEPTEAADSVSSSAGESGTTKEGNQRTRKALFPSVVVESNECYTENGALSYKRTGSACVDLYFKACRGIERRELEKLLRAAWKESREDTLRLIFHLRDCRGGGKGERELFRWSWNWLLRKDWNYCIWNFHCVPHYGRWDDLVREDEQLPDAKGMKTKKLSERKMKDYRKLLSSYLAGVLRHDEKMMKEEGSVSLLAKWIPAEECHAKKHYTVGRAELCEALAIQNGDNINCARLRKQYLTPLRAHLRLIERSMCAQEWDQIEYRHVPSVAMHKFKHCFRKHDKERFEEWLDAVYNSKDPKAKVNAGVLFPHQVVESACLTRPLGRVDDTAISDEKLAELQLAQCQWDMLIEKARRRSLANKDADVMGRSVVVVDVSGSMYWSVKKVQPIYVSVALGLMLSELNTCEAFRNAIISFSSRPAFIDLEQESAKGQTEENEHLPGLTNRIQALIKCTACMGMSTNLQLVFETLLERAQNANIPKDEMPLRVFIISDMQFDEASECETNFQAIERQYRQAGYERPQLVFWNVNGSTTDVPIDSSSQEGVILLSGWSMDVLQAVMECSAEINPYNIMRNAIDAERYRKVVTEAPKVFLPREHPLYLQECVKQLVKQSCATLGKLSTVEQDEIKAVDAKASKEEDWEIIHSSVK